MQFQRFDITSCYDFILMNKNSFVGKNAQKEKIFSTVYLMFKLNTLYIWLLHICLGYFALFSKFCTYCLVPSFNLSRPCIIYYFQRKIDSDKLSVIWTKQNIFVLKTKQEKRQITFNINQVMPKRSLNITFKKYILFNRIIS